MLSALARWPAIYQKCLHHFSLNKNMDKRLLHQHVIIHNIRLRFVTNASCTIKWLKKLHLICLGIQRNVYVREMLFYVILFSISFYFIWWVQDESYNYNVSRQICSYEKDAFIELQYRLAHKQWELRSVMNAQHNI